LITRNPALHTAAIAALEKAINQALKLDSASYKKLGALDGKIFRIDLDGPDLQFFILPSESTLMLMGHYEGAATTQVRGYPSDFVELLTANDAGSALINGNITLKGDSASLLELQAILHNLDLDWEAELAKVVGDIPAHQIGKAVRTGLQWGKQTHNSIMRQVEEYIHEEGRLLPPRAEIDDFFADVSKLTDDSNRLAAKIAKLSRTLASPSKPD
jgi:ubiquinone biosynthesis protein UbiJ